MDTLMWLVRGEAGVGFAKLQANMIAMLRDYDERGDVSAYIKLPPKFLYRVKVIVAALNVRRAPSLTSDVMDTVSPAEGPIDVLAESNGWLEIKPRGDSGWVRARYVARV